MRPPGGVDWWVHRIATSPHYHVDPRAIRESWTFLEVLEVHRVLDAFAEAERGG